MPAETSVAVIGRLYVWISLGAVWLRQDEVDAVVTVQAEANETVVSDEAGRSESRAESSERRFLDHHVPLNPSRCLAARTLVRSRPGMTGDGGCDMMLAAPEAMDAVSLRDATTDLLMQTAKSGSSESMQFFSRSISRCKGSTDGLYFERG